MSDTYDGGQVARVAAAEPSDEHDDTFKSKISIKLDEPVGSMSISPSNRDVVLGARKGLYIIDLESPWDKVRFLPHLTTGEVADIQWSPHPQRAEWVVSTSAQQVLLWNLCMPAPRVVSSSKASSASPIELVISAHSRSVTDINWSVFQPEVLATSGMDSWIRIWDLRKNHKTAAQGFCAWTAGATQVKYNRQDPHRIASSHENIVYIWDDRKSSLPVTTIRAHDSKIYGIDWSRRADEGTGIVTCSLDKTAKYWSSEDSAQPRAIIKTSYPIWRARHLPFGDGIVTLPQRSEHALDIWGRHAPGQPVLKLSGHDDVVKEFVWRVRGGEDSNFDDREFQLISWSKDRHLRLWPISSETLRAVGHEHGSPIQVRMTRRGYKNVSYRDPVAVQSLEAKSRHSSASGSLSTSNETSMRGINSNRAIALATRVPGSFDSPSTSDFSSGFADHMSGGHRAKGRAAKPERPAFMTRTTTNARPVQQDHLAWMEGVRYIRDPVGPIPLEAEVSKSRLLSSRERERKRSSSVFAARRFSDGSRLQSDSSGSRARRVSSNSYRQSNDFADTAQTLGEELALAGRRFSQIQFEVMHVAGRTCTVCLYAPWGAAGSVYVRASFSFPKSYPNRAALTVDIEPNTDIPIKNRIHLLQGLRGIANRASQAGIPSLETCLTYLLNGPYAPGSDAYGIESESSEDEMEPARKLDPSLVRNNRSMPAPRLSGASFGPSGQLVVFSPAVKKSRRRTSTSLSASFGERGRSVSPRPVQRRRIFESFGAIELDEEDLSASAELDVHDVDSDQALQISKTMLSRRTKKRDASANRSTSSRAGSRGRAPNSSSDVTVIDGRGLIDLKPHLSGRYTLQGDVTAICAHNQLVAEEEQLALAARLWELMGMILAPASQDGEPSSRLASSNIILECLSIMQRRKDLQSLGLAACVLELHRRDVQRASELRSGRQQDDYFSARPRRSNKSPHISSRGGSTGVHSVSTPWQALQDGFAHSTSLHSPRGSWSNLASLFNASVFSTHSSSSPNSEGPLQRRMLSNSSFVRRPSGRPSPAHVSDQDSSSPAKTSSTPHSVSPSRRNSLVQGGSSVPRQLYARQRGHSHHQVVAFSSVSHMSSDPSSDRGEVVRAEARQKRVKIVRERIETVPLDLALSDGTLAGEMECYRLNYADLLLRWGYSFEHAEVLNLTRTSVERRSGVAYRRMRAACGNDRLNPLELGLHCPDCAEMLQPPVYRYCPSCRADKATPACALCQLPTTGQVQTCCVCLHTGHIQCYADWYNSPGAECPSGCGCTCLEGGLSRAFVVFRGMTGAKAKARARAVQAQRHGIGIRTRARSRKDGDRLVQLSEDPQEQERSLSTTLKRLGLYAAHTLGDGNCLFRALSDQLWGDPVWHAHIRQQVCDYLAEHKSRYALFVDDTDAKRPETAFEDHVADMRESGTYGSHLEIEAFARSIGRKVKIIQPELMYVLGGDPVPSTSGSATAKPTPAPSPEQSTNALSPKQQGKQPSREDGELSASEANSQSSAMPARPKRKRASTIGGLAPPAIDTSGPPLYIVYHSYEHYSSARNVSGPHAGLPHIKEAPLSAPGVHITEPTDDHVVSAQDEKLIKASLAPDAQRSPAVVREAMTRLGNWEDVVEEFLALDRERIDNGRLSPAHCTPDTRSSSSSAYSGVISPVPSDPSASQARSEQTSISSIDPGLDEEPKQGDTPDQKRQAKPDSPLGKRYARGARGRFSSKSAGSATVSKSAGMSKRELRRAKRAPTLAKHNRLHTVSQADSPGGSNGSDGGLSKDFREVAI
ncbi:uncharacterized protein L969DRAFT_92162 [Mixia osmundae IAM 14324]|uniref:OTU domain-containing protein n=1 Tax=Mixia osmundae (strain CBS 9802 / IAM 14324 / JCM 22182 / KY 12970) TaxID=764103 RepID=G7DT54_MIXOS|nr:uncharacterized protein L969DRAFT_92162 [Mixia osmundae IAM 14324]KEI42733.1 hypothetical protein L969DRAFT_92162 [Mixia osmundae IAM 14324]GAA93933.1 hypothetical protein E5Q_00579 [Mixia osmundae IAM 14324]